MWVNTIWRSGVVRNLLAGGSIAVASIGVVAENSTPRKSTIVSCENINTNTSERIMRPILVKKIQTLRRAVVNEGDEDLVVKKSIRRVDTVQVLSKIRQTEKEMLERWERDEDGWRKLPSRAWPAYQPNSQQLEGIKKDILKIRCHSSSSADNNSICTKVLFDLASALVFNNIDHEAGLKQYEKLAKQGHVDSMVACGIILMEGFGSIALREEEGIHWLRKAVEADSTQGCYELGCIYYTGIDDLLEEDSKMAFELFQKAAQRDHPAAMFLMAECLVDGEGTEQSVARAVPLFYRAAEFGHRYSRQRIRQLLASEEYQT